MSAQPSPAAVAQYSEQHLNEVLGDPSFYGGLDFEKEYLESIGISAVGDHRRSEPARTDPPKIMRIPAKARFSKVLKRWVWELQMDRAASKIIL